MILDITSILNVTVVKYVTVTVKNVMDLKCTIVPIVTSDISLNQKIGNYVFLIVQKVISKTNLVETVSFVMKLV